MSSAAIPETMRGLTIPKHGPASLIEMSTLSTPNPAPSELLIKIEYSGVNFIDTYQRSGVYANTTWPMILGNEGAGEIVKLPTDPKVLEDPHYKRNGFQIGTKVAVRARGTQAEYVAAPFISMSPLPASVSTRVAAASTTQGLTALTFLTEAYAPHPGDWILVHTAAGGLGLLLTQLATARGANVIGTTSSEEKANIARESGAKEVIIYTKEDTVARVLDITGGEGVHAVFDGVGRDTWDNNFKLIRRKGTIVSVGNASGVVPPFSRELKFLSAHSFLYVGEAIKLGEKNVKVLRPVVYNYLATPEESSAYATELWNLVSQGMLNVKVHKEYPFTAEGVQQSHDDIVGRGTVGKLIVKVA